MAIVRNCMGEIHSSAVHHTSNQTYNTVTTMSSEAYDTAPKQHS